MSSAAAVIPNGPKTTGRPGRWSRCRRWLPIPARCGPPELRRAFYYVEATLDAAARSNWTGVATGYGFSESPSKWPSFLAVNKLAPQTNGGLTVEQLEQAHNSQRKGPFLVAGCGEPVPVVPLGVPARRPRPWGEVEDRRRCEPERNGPGAGGARRLVHPGFL